MYWLIGSLIIIAMMGVLAVADSMAIPTSSSLMDIFNTPTLSLSLIIFAIILIVIAQFIDDIFQAVMSAMAAALLKLGNPWWQIEFIMRYQNTFWWDLKKLS